MSTKRMEAMRKKMAEAAVRVDDRQAAAGGPPERLDIPAAAVQAQQIHESVYAELNANKAENHRLREKLAAMNAPGAAQQVDPNLVDVPGFNRLVSSLDPESDPDFARFCENIRVFGGNKQPAMVRPSPASPDRYDLVFGERRLRACQLTGAPFTAIVSEMDDNELLLLRELENVGRKDKSLIERAFSLTNLPERLARGTRDELLESLKISRMTFQRLRRIASVPLEIWTSIPQPQTTTVREAMAVCEAYEADPVGVKARARALSPSLSHAEALQKTGSCATARGKDNGSGRLARKGKKIHLRLAFASHQEALRLEHKLSAWLRQSGINVEGDEEQEEKG